jgi:hypothetical protein
MGDKFAENFILFDLRKKFMKKYLYVPQIRKNMMSTSRDTYKPL